ncbi:hypothetical protein [Paracoccus jeotgali]|uniref:Uncharacterized protein n=1 Tax=Paracoccus jeotgali TaxID=2065379 RepID=A0A2K9MID4_9RHOB|nr:hypothetical protein [Paracoccus jeotgali]AUM75381.1 hypothetical protein CYR75_14725 [Paracoccus jeotgali]
MAKTPFDRERSIGSGRLRAFTVKERESGLHPTILILHRRPHQRSQQDSRKLGEYARIARGWQV